MSQSVRVGVISDTHGRLPDIVHELFAGVDHILHAGDVGGLQILADLETIAPVTGVWGNTDGFAVRARLGEVERLELGGRSVVVVHGHQVGSPTPGLLASAYDSGDIVVFGHSHIAVIQYVGPRLFLNPGSAGAPRFGTRPSLALLELTPGDEDARIIEL